MSSIDKNELQIMFQLNKTQVNKLVKNNKLEDIVVYIVLLSHIYDTDDKIANVIRFQSTFLKMSLLDVMLKPKGINKILTFVSNKGYILPEVEIIEEEKKDDKDKTS